MLPSCFPSSSRAYGTSTKRKLSIATSNSKTSFSTAIEMSSSSISDSQTDSNVVLMISCRPAVDRRAMLLPSSLFQKGSMSALQLTYGPAASFCMLCWRGIISPSMTGAFADVNIIDSPGLFMREGIMVGKLSVRRYLSSQR